MDSLSQKFSGGRGRARISLTPLIDVVFILLVFFMLASNFQQKRSVELATPDVENSAAISAHNKTLRIVIQSEGKYKRDDEIYSHADIKKLLQENIDKTIFLDAANTAEVQDVVFFMDLAAKLGITKIRLADVTND